MLDPTLPHLESMIDDRPGKMAQGYAAVADSMPAQVRRGFLYGGLPVPAGQDQRYQDSFQRMLDMAKAFYDAGIPIVAGTDSYAGLALHRELELYEKPASLRPRYCNWPRSEPPAWSSATPNSALSLPANSLT